MWRGRTILTNKLVGELCKTQCTCRTPSSIRTYAGSPAQPASTAGKDTRNQSVAAPADEPSRLRLLLGEAYTVGQAPRPMAEVVLPKYLSEIDSTPTSVTDFTFSSYAQTQLAKFDEHIVPEAALTMLEMTLPDVAKLLESLVVKCLSWMPASIAKITDPELMRAGRTHYMYSTLAPLLDNKGFNNMLSIIVYEAPNAAKEDLILIMASLAYFRGEESLSTIKSVIERVATPLKPSLGRLTPEELCIFFHVYSVYAIADTASWQEAMAQLQARLSLFPPRALAETIVSLTTAPLIAGQVTVFLSKFSVRLRPIVVTMGAEEIALLLKAYRTATGKGSREAISFYQTLITDAHSHAPHCSPAQLYSMVSSMMDVSEYNAGFALLVEKHLTDTYAFWSTQSFIKLMTYIRNSGVKPSPVLFDVLTVRVYDQLKTLSSNEISDITTFLLECEELSPTLAEAMCQSICRNPKALLLVDLESLAKVILTVSDLPSGKAVLPVLMSFIIKSYTSMPFDMCTSVLRALITLDREYYSVPVLNVIQDRIQVALNEFPASLKTCCFAFLLRALLGLESNGDGLSDLQDNVNKLASNLSSTNLDPKEVTVVLSALVHCLNKSIPLTQEIQQLRHVAAVNVLDFAMTNNVFDDVSCRQLDLALRTFANDSTTLNEDDRQIYENLLQFVSGHSLSANPHVSGSAYFQLVSTVFSLCKKKDSTSLEMKSVIQMLDMAVQPRSVLLPDLKVVPFTNLLRLVSVALKDNPVLLKFWLLALTAQGSVLFAKMEENWAVHVLKIFAEFNSISIQLLRPFADHFRHVIVAFSPSDLLVVMQCFHAVQFNPDGFVESCANHLMLSLKSLSAPEIKLFIVLSASLGDAGRAVMPLSVSIILDRRLEFSSDDLLACARAFARCGVKYDEFLGVVCGRLLPIVQDGPAKERLNAAGQADYVTAASGVLSPELRSALETCLLSDEIKEVAATSLPLHHRYASAALALCLGPKGIQQEILEHVFQADLLRELFTGSGGEGDAVPDHVLETFRSLYDYVLVHPSCAGWTIDEDIAQECGFADRVIKEQDLMVDAIMAGEDFTFEKRSHVWPFGLSDLAAKVHATLKLPANVYRQILPAPFGTIHMLLVRDAKGKLVEVPELDPSLSLRDWCQELRDKCPALGHKESVAYAFFCPTHVEKHHGRRGLTQLWMELLEANKLHPIPFKPEAFNFLSPEVKEAHVRKMFLYKTVT